MYHTIIYNGTYEYDDEIITLEDYEYTFYEDKEVVVSFYYEQEYGYPYRGISVGTEEFNFVTNIENKWLYNEIDTWELYNRNYAFKEWVYDYYLEDALKEYMSEHLWESYDDYDEEEEEEEDE